MSVPDDLIERHVSGVASPEERAELAVWLERQPELADELYAAALREIDCREAFRGTGSEGGTARMQRRVGRRRPGRRRYRLTAPLVIPAVAVGALAVILLLAVATRSPPPPPGPEPAPVSTAPQGDPAPMDPQPASAIPDAPEPDAPVVVDASGPAAPIDSPAPAPEVDVPVDPPESDPPVVVDAPLPPVPVAAPEPDAPEVVDAPPAEPAPQYVARTRRVHTCADGSAVAILTGTDAAVAEDDDGVVVTLSDGLIRCRVEPRRAGSSFRVVAGRVEIEVIGTAFSVHRRGDLVALRMHQGRAAIRHGGRRGVGVAGELWLADDRGLYQLRPIVAVDFRGADDPAYADPAAAVFTIEGVVAREPDGWRFDGGRAVAPELGAALVAACTASGACTIAVVVSPATSEQFGPARIVANSRDQDHGNVLLLHGGNRKGDGNDRYQLRLRHDGSTDSRGEDFDLWSAPGSAAAEASQVVIATRETGGAARLHVDDQPMAAVERPGSIAVWDPECPLVLGNERAVDRPWRGRLGSLLVLDRALSPPEAALLVQLLAD